MIGELIFDKQTGQIFIIAVLLSPLLSTTHPTATFATKDSTDHFERF